MKNSVHWTARWKIRENVLYWSSEIKISSFQCWLTNFVRNGRHRRRRAAQKRHAHPPISRKTSLIRANNHLEWPKIMALCFVWKWKNLRAVASAKAAIAMLTSVTKKPARTMWKSRKVNEIWVKMCKSRILVELGKCYGGVGVPSCHTHTLKCIEAHTVFIQSSPSCRAEQQRNA